MEPESRRFATKNAAVVGIGGSLLLLQHSRRPKKARPSQAGGGAAGRRAHGGLGGREDFVCAALGLFPEIGTWRRVRGGGQPKATRNAAIWRAAFSCGLLSPVVVVAFPPAAGSPHDDERRYSSQLARRGSFD